MADNGHQEKALSKDTLAKTIQAEPQSGPLQSGPGDNWFTITLASAADTITPWGAQWRLRDQQLRQFWPTEPVVSGAICTIAARNAALSWKLNGPTRTVEVAQDLLHSADLGLGWVQFITKLTLDLVSQDNGAFIEVARDDYISGEEALKRVESGKPLPPVVGISHLDAGACWRTGHRLYPVVYRDPDDYSQHLMPWHMVIPLTEMPSPIKRMRNIQYSALTRILRSAQIYRDYGIYKHEKISGRFAKAVHVLGGVNKAELVDIMKRGDEQADNSNLTRYMMPYILASLDPTKPVSQATIELASLPDGFDYDAELRWYITQIALTFLEDYQTFAPLPGGGLGTSQQSVILAMKGRGKGVGLFMKSLTHIFNFWGILPRTVQFEFDETDPLQDKEKADLLSTQVNTLQAAISAGLMTDKVARQYAADNDILLNEEYLAMMAEEDATPDETVTDEQPVESTEDIVPIDAQPVQELPPTETPPSLLQNAAQGVAAVKSFFAQRGLGLPTAKHRR